MGIRVAGIGSTRGGFLGSAAATVAFLLAGASSPTADAAREPTRASTERATQAAGPGGTRPHLTLVLSGGGARGAAHIGVLKVLEELHVKPDLIVGTSMGSIVGGLYAAGYSAAEIERIFMQTDWKYIFIDRIDRRERSYRRSQDDLTFLIPLRLRFKDWKPFLPTALLGGQRLEMLLRSLEIEATGATDFDDLPIPYRAVAADLENSEPVVLGEGNLSTAMRASMSIAGVFPPVEINGRKLVDGGTAANLPVGIAQSLGAETLIAVDIATPPASIEDLGSVFQIFGQYTGYITEVNRLEDLKRLRAGDVLITPELGNISFVAFERVQEAIQIGEQAARGAADKLRRFALDDTAWAAYLAAHHTRPRQETVVDAIRIENTSWVDDDLIAAHLNVPVGQPYDTALVSGEVMRLSGLDYSDVIGTSLERVDQRNLLTFRVPPKPYGHNSLQLGASFADDFQGTATYTLSMRHLLLAANRRGGEWANIAQLGVTSLLRSEFYQPFDAIMKWFTSVGASSRRENWDFWFEGDPVAEYRVTRDEGHIDFGRVFGRWGEARVGGLYGRESVDVSIGLPLPEYNEHDVGFRLAFSVDTLDDVAFPRAGTLVSARWFESRSSWGSDADRSRGDVSIAHALRAGRFTFYPTLEGCANYTDAVTLGSACRLGGFLRLSGLGQDELTASYSVFGRLISYFTLKGMDLGALSQQLYAGISLETGNAYLDADEITWDSLRASGSIFFGARTALGPVYLGYGLSEGGRESLYFLLGQRF